MGLEKFRAWFRRHKTKLLDLGIIIGIALLAWSYFNAPVNINRMEPGDWQNTHISGIGTATIQKLESDVPYQDIHQIDAIPGIGPVKMAQLDRHFTTWDTAKADVWFPGFLIGLVLTFGGGLARYFSHRSRIEDAKIFHDKYIGKRDD